ncbi:hypothetical protein [Shewanella maritima]|uniref:hypothetical protein n=1 Tax=Shewanella maritima TaxID=2520507 RepID=UPI0013EEC118|nr:hypothetical protein [Shewanella maritima]
METIASVDVLKANGTQTAGKHDIKAITTKLPSPVNYHLLKKQALCELPTRESSFIG